MPDRVQEFKAVLRRDGLSIADWAREREYNVRTVYAVLRGELKASRGISHKIAVDAGVKAMPPKAA
jgi:gp16 family phage-associated protein